MEFQPYGCMIALGLLISGCVGKFLARRFCLDFNDILLLFAYALAFGMCGAKCTYLLVNFQNIPWEDISLSFLLDLLGGGGFVFYGGLFSGVLGVFLAVRLHHLDAPSCLHICIPLLPLAHAFGRIGCFLAGCCYGIEYDGCFSVIYTDSLIAPTGVALFPVQILESLILLMLAVLLLWQLFRGTHLAGLLITYMAAYSVCRYYLEFLRGDVMRGKFLGLSTSQWGSIVLLLSIPLGLFLYSIRKKKKRPS